MKTMTRITLVALVSAGVYALRGLINKSPAGYPRGPKSRQPPLQTWEGEGGALHATGSQMGPDPRVDLH